MTKTQERKPGCIAPILSTLIPIFGIIGGAEYANFWIILIVLIAILYALAFGMIGIALLALPFKIIKNLLTGKRPIIDLAAIENDDILQKRAWIVIPISTLLFWVNYLIISRHTPDLYIYLGFGLAYGAVQYWMMKNHYFDPLEYDFEVFM